MFSLGYSCEISMRFDVSEEHKIFDYGMVVRSVTEEL